MGAYNKLFYPKENDKDRPKVYTQMLLDEQVDNPIMKAERDMLIKVLKAIEANTSKHECTKDMKRIIVANFVPLSHLKIVGDIKAYQKSDTVMKLIFDLEV